MFYNDKNANAGTGNGANFLKSLFVGAGSAVVSMPAMILIYLLLWPPTTNATDRLIMGMAIALSTLIGGFIGGKTLKRRGLLIGLLIGLIAWVIVILFIMAFDPAAPFTGRMVILLALAALSGTIGGIFGVNTSGGGKRRRIK